jgi:hypothetical protein
MKRSPRVIASASNVTIAPNTNPIREAIGNSVSVASRPISLEMADRGKKSGVEGVFTGMASR